MPNPTIPTLTITAESITLILGDHELRFDPEGGPNDPVLVSCGDGEHEFTRDQIDQLQSALVNFLNTGYFYVEG